MLATPVADREMQGKLMDSKVQKSKAYETFVNENCCHISSYLSFLILLTACILMKAMDV